MDFSIFDWLQRQFASGAPNAGVTGLLGNGGISPPPADPTPGAFSAGVTGLLGNGGIPTGPTDPAAEVQEAVRAEPPRQQVPMPDIGPTQTVGMHPVQNPAESQTPTTAPDSGITIRRISSTPVDPNERKLSAQLESLGKAGMKLAQAGQPQRSGGGGAAPQVHRGQAVSLLDLVFPNRKNMF